MSAGSEDQRPPLQQSKYPHRASGRAERRAEWRLGVVRVKVADAPLRRRRSSHTNELFILVPCCCRLMTQSGATPASCAGQLRRSSLVPSRDEKVMAPAKATANQRLRPKMKVRCVRICSRSRHPSTVRMALAPSMYPSLHSSRNFPSRLQAAGRQQLSSAPARSAKRSHQSGLDRTQMNHRSSECGPD